MNPFYVKPLGGQNPAQGYMQGLQMKAFREEGERRDRFDQQEEQAAMAQAAKSEELASLVDSGDERALRKFVSLNPEMSKGVADNLKWSDEESKQTMLGAYAAVYQNPEQAEQILSAAVEQGERRGIDMTQSRNDLMQIRSGQLMPEQIKSNAATALLFTGEDGIKTFDKLNQEGGANIGNASPKDFTVESLAAYSDSGEIGDLVRYTPKVKDIAGVPHQYNQSTLKWEPLVNMAGPEITEQATAAANLEADKQSRLDFAKQKTKWEGSQTKLLGSIGEAEQKQTVMSNTIAKINDLVGNLSTEYGASLSNIPGSKARTLKGLLDTLKANSAFTTLADLKASGGTLGAISEAELNLLERAWGAIDQGGDTQELLRVIEQIRDQNTGSVQRLRNAYNMDKKRYSGGYEDTQRQIEQENTVSWDSL